MKIKVWRKIVVYFYPRPPRGGRQIFLEDNPWNGEFLSTPSARRATGGISGDTVRPVRFLSTPSARRATRLALLVGQSVKHFYPRPPRGGRPPFLILLTRNAIISIHALREEGDTQSRPALDNISLYFYPRPPRGGRRKGILRQFRGQEISIHALREEGDEIKRIYSEKYEYFYPRPPRGGRRSAP